MNSNKGKQPSRRQKQPARRSVKQQKPVSQAQKPRAAAPRARASKPTASAPAKRTAPKAKAAPDRSGEARQASPSRRAAASRPGGQGVSRAKRGKGKAPRSHDLPSRIASSRAAVVVIAVACAIAVVGVFDLASNWGKAYGNVSINGVSVAGMTADEMREALQVEFSSRVSHAQVTIYADDEAQAESGDAAAQAEREATAEQLSAEDAYGAVGEWQVDALSLKATVPYDDAIERALALGRGDGGVAKRLSLLVSGQDIPLEVSFDDGLVEDLASQIDLTIGNPRIDATVVVEDGVARPVAGQPGSMVDRGWLKDMISRAMIRGDVPDSFVARAIDAQSRITDAQAESMAASINRAIAEGVLLSYQGRSWLAGPLNLGDWTRVSVVEGDGGWDLAPAIDSSQAIPTIVDKLGAEMTSDDVVVTFEGSGSDLSVRTSGTGNVPEVASAVDALQATLYGPDGIAWGDAVGEAPAIEVTESARPESLSFEDAVNLGVIAVIGECTTEFSDVEGTENRNHNIKLAADLLDDSIIEADGGTWSFNDRAGDTNEEAGFWTAGSIVDGEYVDSVGGGICQVATTVFNSVLEAGLEVLERHNHTLYIASYPTGRDAAIDYPTDLDLMWKNDLESDIVLKMSYTDTSVTTQLYSVYTGYSSEYEIGDWEEGEEYETLFEEDDTLGEGAYYRKTVGEDGSKIMVTRYVTDDKGRSVRTDAFESNYEAKDEVYVVGPGVDTSELVDEDREHRA